MARLVSPVTTTHLKTAWVKSSFCQSGECAEVTVQDDAIAVRSNRSPAEVVRFTAAEWRAFAAGVKAGEFDLPG